MAEFWARRDGLLLAIQMGIPYLEVELDARSIVNLVLSSLTPNRAYSPFLNDCRSMFNRFQQVQVNHIFWEVNSCAEAMVKRGCLQQGNLCNV